MQDGRLIMTPFAAPADDGYVLNGFLWQHGIGTRPVVIINAATSVRCRYYSRFADYLFARDFDVVIYDYRGIGESRPATLRGFRADWVDWGQLDFEAILRFTLARFGGQAVYVVAHSIGGFVIGLAPSNHQIARIFTMGAQFAYWRDYAPEQRAAMWVKWHVLMPGLATLLGYFPGKRLGWLEDTPKGVAQDWGRMQARFEQSVIKARRHPQIGETLARRFATVTAPILALGTQDDPFGTVNALNRLLAYYTNSPTQHLRVAPQEIGVESIGHFAFFHSRFERTLWPLALAWLKNEPLPTLGHRPPVT